MPDDMSYTPEEVAKILKISRFTVYEMIKRGDLAAYRIGRKMRIEALDLENYKKKAKGGSVLLPLAALQQTDDPLDHSGLIICGQDVVLDILTRHLERKIRDVRFLRHYIGSINGLISLYNRTANLVTAHLWDGDTDQYNVPYVRHYLPGQRAVIVNLVYRIEGFYVAPGNPTGIKDWIDLIRPDIRFVNREKGAGARVLLDEKLRKLDIDARKIAGYEREEMSHLAVASCVARGEADVGLGTEKAAMQVQNVEFIPLQKERYDMVILKQDLEKAHFQAVLAILKSKPFQNEVAGMGGYDVSRMGDIMGEV